MMSVNVLVREGLIGLCKRLIDLLRCELLTIRDCTARSRKRLVPKKENARIGAGIRVPKTLMENVDTGVDNSDNDSGTFVRWRAAPHGWNVDFGNTLIQQWTQLGLGLDPFHLRQFR